MFFFEEFQFVDGKVIIFVFVFVVLGDVVSFLGVKGGEFFDFEIVGEGSGKLIVISVLEDLI